MQATIVDLQNLIYDFYLVNQRIPNTLLIPAGQQEINGLSPSKIESVMCLKVIYAAISSPRCAIL